MSATNPAYTPAAGDIFSINAILGGASKLVTVVSGSGTQFVGNDGGTYDTRSANVSIYSTTHLSSVASVSAGPGNTGSGAIAGVGVNAPAIDLDLPYTGINSASSNQSGQPYLIVFSSTTAYSVKNAAGAAVASGTYSNPTTITFLGISVQITGAPAAGDSFVIQPLG